VQKILLAVDATDNAAVHNDFAEAARSMPVLLAAPVASREADWVTSQPNLVWLALAEEYGRLAAYLARGGAGREALHLLVELLAVGQDPRTLRQDQAGEKVAFPQPKLRIDMWEYAKILARDVPPVVEACRLKAVEALIELLDRAVQFSRHDPLSEGDDDYSYIWLPDLAGEHADATDNVREALVFAVRDGAIAVATREPKALARVLTALRRGRSTVFRRIELYLLAMTPTARPAQIATQFFKRGYLERIAALPEYSLLLKTGFPRISAQDQQKLLGRIARGPSVQRIRRFHHQFQGSPASDKYVRDSISEWKRDRLAPIGEALPALQQAELQRLVSDTGAPEAFTRRSVQVGWRSAATDLDVDFSSMSLADVVTRIAEIDSKQSEQRRDSYFSILVELGSSVERLSGSLNELLRLRPAIAATVFTGLRQAMQEGKALPWAEVLPFALRVVEAEGGSETSGRRGVAHFIEDVLKDEVSRPRIENRALVWNTIRALLVSNQPSPEQESPAAEPTMAALNSSRGLAMHAVLRYALWVRQELTDKLTKNQPIGELMPEVRNELEKHLVRDADASPAIRSVYGQWFPWLVSLDAAWATSHAMLIFDDETLGNAAWESYVVYCGAFDSVVPILMPYYQRAVNALRTRAQKPKSRDAAAVHLAEHLAVIYWRGLVELDASGLVDAFFVGAEPELRSHLLDFVGRSLQNSNNVPMDYVRRLQRLWEWRRAMVEVAADPLGSKELASFGWWFASGVFPDDWAIAELERTIRLCSGAVKPEHAVIERLATMATKHPLESIRALSGILLGEREYASMWPSESRAVLAVALGSDDAVARAEADVLIDKLGRRGLIQLRDLASQAKVSSPSRLTL
jgi:hypothetical protein